MLSVRMLLVLFMSFNSSFLLAGESYPHKRIFTTADQRSYLDQNRGATIVRDTISNQSTVYAGVPTSQASKRNIKFSGYIENADGDVFIWVDGRSKLSRKKTSIEASRGVRQERVPLKIDNRAVYMAPGQQYDREKRQVGESFTGSAKAGKNVYQKK